MAGHCLARWGTDFASCGGKADHGRGKDNSLGETAVPRRSFAGRAESAQTAERVHAADRLGVRFARSKGDAATLLHLLLRKTGESLSGCGNQARFSAQLPPQLPGVAGRTWDPNQRAAACD